MSAQSFLVPTKYADVRKPVTQASTLPPYCYTDREWYDLEVERMWRHNWLVLGRVEEAPNPGDFQRVDIVGEPLIMVRGQDRVLRVMSAICRHRGCLVKQGKGNGKFLTCPYHAWTYNLAGELVSVPGMGEIENFDKRDFSLVPVRSETWGGFVFVNFDPDAPPLMASLGELAKRFESYHFEEMKVTRKLVNRIEANWKLWLENSREGYHAPVVHAKTYHQYFQGRNSRGWEYSGIKGIYEILSGSNDDGLYLPRDPAFPMVESLSDYDKETTHFALFYPHLLLNVPPSHLAFHQLFPHGPDATTVVTWFCFPDRTLARPDFEREARPYYEIVEAFVPEDKEISALTQQGLTGHLSRAGRFSVHERPCHGFANWLLDQVVGAT